MEPKQPPAVRRIRIDDASDGQRLDNFLLKILPGVPRSHVYRIVRSGQVRVNGGRVGPQRRIRSGDEVRVPPVRMPERGETPRPPDDLLERLARAVRFEDDHYVVLDKPPGLAVHGGSGVLFGIIEVARAWQRHDYLELCHRLDRDTSGVLLLAKTRPALLRAQSAFRDGTARKRYAALLCGRWKGGTRSVEAALAKQLLRGGERMAQAEAGGKPSRSIFTPRQRFSHATLCDVDIRSGRMHQIRVHAADLGHPVAGDRKYGDAEVQRPWRKRGLRRTFLHAAALRLPATEALPLLQLESPLPEDLSTVLDRLKSTG